MYYNCTQIMRRPQRACLRATCEDNILLLLLSRFLVIIQWTRRRPAVLSLNNNIGIEGLRRRREKPTSNERFTHRSVRGTKILVGKRNATGEISWNGRVSSNLRFSD